MKLRLAIDSNAVVENLTNYWLALNAAELEGKKVLKAYDCLGGELELNENFLDGSYSVIMPIVFSDRDTVLYVEY